MNPREKYKVLIEELRGLLTKLQDPALAAEDRTKFDAEFDAKKSEAVTLKAEIDKLDRREADEAFISGEHTRVNQSRGSVTDAPQGVEHPGEPPRARSIGAFVTNSDAYKNRQGGRFAVNVPGLYLPGQDFTFGPLERFAVVAGGGLSDPLVVQGPTPAIRPVAPLRPTVRDALTNVTTNLNLITYIVENPDDDNNAAAFFDADGTNVKPESDYGLTDGEAPVRTIATTMPVREEMLDDVSGLQARIETRLVQFLRDAEDDALLNGNGTPPEILGIRNMDIQILDGSYFSSNAVPGVGEDREDIDRLQAGVTAVGQIGLADANVVIMTRKALDFFLGVTNSNGDYYAGNPFATTSIPRFRGLAIIVSNKMPNNKGLVLDGRFFIVHDKMEARVDAGYVDKQFAQNWKTLRAEERIALEGDRPKAAAEVTWANIAA